MRIRIIPLGHARGIRLPKSIIEQAGLADEVELEVRGNTLVIAPSRGPRTGMTSATGVLHTEAGDSLLDLETHPPCDEDDW